MPELDDHNTDALFQAGASQHDFSYDPAAWEQMEALLENEERARRRRFAWFLRLGLLLLALSVVGYYQWGSGETQIVAAGTEASEAPADTTDSSARAASAGLADPASGNKPYPVGPANTPLVNRPATLPTGIQPENTKRSPTTPQANSAGQAVTNALREAGKPQKIAGDNDLGPSSIVGTIAPEVAGGNMVIPETSSLAAVPLALPLLPPLPLSSVIQAPGWPQRDMRPMVAQEATPTRRPLFTLGLSAGVVFSAIKTPELGKGTTRFGAKFNYHLSDHFAIGTGVYLTNSWYEAAGADYQIKEEDFWTYDIQPESVRARCAILDVPLSVTYHPRGGSRAGLYVGAGLSSYFMLRENYYYEYEIPNNDFLKMWMETNANQHLMGVGQFHLGYQRPYGRRSALQVESFIHLPLAGIGHGQVRLVTVGATVNYAFGVNRKK